MVLIAVDMHEHSVGRNESNVMFHTARCHIALVGIHTVGDLSMSVLWKLDAPAVHALFAPSEGVALSIACIEIGEVLGKVQYLIVARCPTWHDQHHLAWGIDLGSVVELHVQVVPDGVHRDGVVHRVVDLWSVGACCHQQDRQQECPRMESSPSFIVLVHCSQSFLILLIIKCHPAGWTTQRCPSRWCRLFPVVSTFQYSSSSHKKSSLDG